MAFANQLSITKNYTLTAPNGVVIVTQQEITKSKEDTELINLVSWFKREYPHLKNMIMHAPNESMKPVQGRVIDAKKGLLPDAPDLLILSNFIAIEMKRSNPKDSLKSTKDREHCESQIALMSAMADCGWRCFLCFGAESAKEAIKSLTI